MTTEELQNLLPQNLIRFRKANKLTQLELAEKLNYSDKAISKWERGDGYPDIFVLNQLAEIYNISLNDFFVEHKTTPTRIEKIKISLKNKTVITMLSFTLVWFIACLAFTLLELLSPNTLNWLVFLYAIPISTLVVYIFTNVWGNNWLKFLFITIFCWTLILSVYLTFKLDNLWLLFICCGSFQILIILWFWLRYDRKRKNKK